MLGSPVWRGAPVVAFCAGLLAGGAAIATLFLLLGTVVRAPLPTAARTILAAAWYAVILAREVGWIRLRLPENRRLVPETVFRLGRYLGPFQFGLEMGTGVRTYLPTGLPYALAGAIALVAAPVPAVVAGLGFGFGRCLMLLGNLAYDRFGGWDKRWEEQQGRLKAGLVATFTVMIGLALFWG